MAGQTKSKGGKKNRKIGRDVKKCATYRNLHTREKNKLGRILQSNGRATAEVYARTNNLSDWFRRRYPLSA